MAPFKVNPKSPGNAIKKCAVFKQGTKSKSKTVGKELNFGKIYVAAAIVLQKIYEKKGHLKTLVYQSKHSNKKHLLYLVLNTLKRKEVIDQVLEKAKLPSTSKNLPYSEVIVFELLFGRGKVYPIKENRDLQKNKAKLVQVLKAIISNPASKATTKLQLLQTQVFLPKYARVNTLLVSVADVILLLRDEKIGHVKYDRDVLSFEEFLAKVQTVRKNAFIVDYHFPDILVFNPNQPLYSTKAYKQGFINISDKASCFPVRMLDPKPGCIAMDACAAPGMKTCHMATLMQNKGQIFASDWKANRVKTMETILSSSGVTCCEVKCQNFLRINPFDEPYNSVQYALVDPSCSSSGMVGRLSELLPDLPDQKETKEDKIKKLAHFQIAVLKHAMSFPNIKRIAYSTCSINVEENEMVVETVLSYFPDQYEVVDTFPNWPERGDQSFEFGCKCVRAYPKKHLTNGFFVAVLERVEDVPLRMVLPDDGGDIHSNRSKIIKIIKEVEIESNDEMECSQNLSPSMVKVESIDDGSVKSKLELSGDVESSKELENSSVSSTDIEALIISKKELQMKNQFVSNISNHTPSIQNITCIENSKIKKKMKNVINKKPKFTVTKMEWQ